MTRLVKDGTQLVLAHALRDPVVLHLFKVFALLGVEGHRSHHGLALSVSDQSNPSKLGEMTEL